jgi:hypothetical protein
LDACAGLERIKREDFCQADALQFADKWNMELCGSAPVICAGVREICAGVRETAANDKGAEYALTRSETPGFWQCRFHIGVRSGKTEAGLALLDMRRIALVIDREP